MPTCLIANEWLAQQGQPERTRTVAIHYQSKKLVSAAVRLCSCWQKSGGLWKIIEAFGSDLGLEAVDELRDGPSDTDESPFTLRDFGCDCG